MSSMVLKFICAGVLFLVTIVAGIWLSNSGKPLNPLLFNFHKLTALAAVIFAALTVRELYISTQVTAFTAASLIALGVFILTLFVTGALLSLGKPVNRVVLAIHGAVTAISLIMAVAITLMGTRK